MCPFQKIGDVDESTILTDLASSVDQSSDVMLESTGKSVDLPVPCVSGAKDLNERPSSRIEEFSIPVSLFQKAKIRPSKKDDPVPLMSKYVTVAVCRQKLHDEVLKECTTIFLADAFDRKYDLRSILENRDFHALGASSQRKDVNKVRRNLLQSCFAHCIFVS